MTRPNRGSLTVPLVAAFLVVAAATAGWAQQPPAKPAEDAAMQGALSPVEVQRYFDAYVVMAAQEALALTDEQLSKFLPRLRALQQSRRRLQQRRNQIVQELARLTAPGSAEFDEARARDRLRALDELETGGAVETRKAYEELTSVLNLRQQARFRVFEDQMERRKLDLLMRARRGAVRRMPSVPE